LAEVQPVAAPVPTPQRQPEPKEETISFRNGRAVGISIGVAAATFLCLPLVALMPGAAALGMPVLLAAGGFVAALLYAKRSRRPLSGGSGAKLGWMTGLWFFLVCLVIATIFVMAMNSPMRGDLIKQMQMNAQLAHIQLPEPNAIASSMLIGAVQIFFFATLFPIFGGIIGARFVSRNRPSA
jgi:hypothetical protein